MLRLNQWRDAALNPIDQQSAVGSSARLGERFDGLQQEVANDLALVGEPTDWRKVLMLSHDILASESKDLLVLVYGMRAVVEAYGYEGLDKSLAILKCYIEQFWAESFPPLKRKRARVAALEWLAQQLEAWVANNQPDQKDKAQIESILSAAKSINLLLSELGSDWQLDLFIVSRSLKEYLSTLPAEPQNLEADPAFRSDIDSTQAQTTADVVPINPATSDADSAATLPNAELNDTALNDTDLHSAGLHSTGLHSTGLNNAALHNRALHKPKAAISSPATTPVSPQVSITDERSHGQSVRQIQLLLKDLAKYRLSKNLADPSAYEINRFSVWLPVTELPLHQNGLTPLRSVPAEKRHFFETLFQQRQYEILIMELESSLSNAPFWLDGHRMVVECLNAIDLVGESTGAQGAYHSSIALISAEMKSFIERLKGIECLKFSDGSPFADEATLSWLGSIDSNDADFSSNMGQDKQPLLNTDVEPSADAEPNADVEPNDKNTVEAQEQSEASVISASNKAYKESGFSAGFLILDQYSLDQTSKLAWYNARLLVIQYCFNAKEYQFAEPLLVELDELAVRHNLDEWEPQLVSRMLSMMLICKSKLKRKQAVNSDYQRLVKIDTKRGYEMKSFAN